MYFHYSDGCFGLKECLPSKDFSRRKAFSFSKKRLVSPLQAMVHWKKEERGTGVDREKVRVEGLVQVSETI